METITSAQNPKIKNLLLLQEKSRARREQGLFVVEGRRELEHCLEAGFSVKTVFVCPEICGELTAEGVVSQISGHPRPDKREGPAGAASGRGRSEAEAICDTIPSAGMSLFIEGEYGGNNSGGGV